MPPERGGTEPEVPPLFIVGAERSGTTLLRVMLNSHPQLAVPPDFPFIGRTWSLRWRYARAHRRLDANRMAQEVMTSKFFRDWDLDRERVLDAIARVDDPGFADVIACFFIAYASAHGKVRWGDKTPTNSLDIPLIARLFPGCKFIHLIRDGRDVAQSLRKASFGPNSVARAAERWTRHTRTAIRAGAALESTEYLEVRYEDLVDDAERVLRDICRFVGLPFDGAMLTYEAGALEALPPRLWQQHHNVARPPRRYSDWRTALSARDLAIVEAIEGSLLVHLGYGLSGHSIPLTARFAAVGSRLSVKVRRAVLACQRWWLTVSHPHELPPPRT